MSTAEKKYNRPLQATLNGIRDLMRNQERVGELGPGERLEGKKILITGASSGLGFAVSKQLAERGAEVIMAARSGIPAKAEEVRKISSNEKVYMLHVDLSEPTSIQKLVSQVKEQFGRIDILICNAAVVVREARRTTSGFDEMFMVNYLAKFILINTLLKEGCIGSSDGTMPRIIVVSSESHRNPSHFEWESFGEFRPHKMTRTVERYGYYKLLLTTFVQELERRLNTGPEPKYSVFALCPGPVNSNIAREAPAVFQPLLKLIFRIFFRSPEKAAEPVVYLATAKAMEGISREYLFLMSRKAVDPKAADPENGRTLWEKTENLLRKANLN